MSKSKSKKHRHQEKDESTMKLAGMKELRDYQIDLKDYSPKGELGRGNFGRVWKGQSLLTGWMVAVKELMSAKLTDDELKTYQREIQILAECNDQFLLDFIGFTVTPPYSIVTCFMPSGSLWDMLHNKQGPGLNATQKTNIAMGIAHGMKYLHAHGIIHRDLKSPNILLDERLLPKVADFGLGRFVSDSDKSSQPMTQNVGTPIWMAPELFGGEQYRFPVDVYAYGMILYELLTEEIPFKGLNTMQIVSILSRDQRPVIPKEHQGSPIAALIERCWAREPSERPTFEEIYAKFESVSVMFPQAEARGVKVLIHEIQQQERIVKNAVTTAAENLNDILRMRSQQMDKGKIQNLLTQYAREGKVVEITKLLTAYLHLADVNGVDYYGMTPLHTAVMADSLLVVQYLTRIKAVDKNCRDKDGNTPLMVAVKNGNVRMVLYLAQAHGVNPNLQNNLGQTALHIVGTLPRDQQKELLKALARASDLDVDVVDNKGVKAVDVVPDIRSIRKSLEKAKSKRSKDK